MNNDATLRDVKMPLPCLSGSERRLAVSKQTPPQGDAAIVLDWADAKLAGWLDSSDLMKRDNLVALREDLFERSVVGTAKYGTPLRINNGRDPVVDLYQELLDAVMYAGQIRMENGNQTAGGLFELLCNLASQVAGELDKREPNPAR